MNPTITTALIGAVCAIAGALASFWIQSRRLPSDIRLTDAQAEKAQHEAATLVIDNLSREVDRLKLKLAELETRLTKAESKAASADEFRRAVIALGERLDRERAKSRDMVGKLVGVIERLLSCIENPEHERIDRAEIAKFLSDIMGQYQPEQFVRV